MKIGIFGGSFNPPHEFHKNIALELIKKKIVDKVIFVPTGNQYYKTSLLDATHRLNMLHLLCRDNPSLLVSDFEIKNQLVSTYQTLDHFKSIYPDTTIYFILGSDNLKELDTWKRYKYLIQTYQFIIIKRNTDDVSLILEKFKNYAHHFIVTDIPKNSLSSTKIRNIIKEHKQIPQIYLHPSIYHYIEQNHLYI